MQKKKKKNKKEKQCAGYFYAYIGMKMRSFRRLLSLIYGGMFYCVSKNIFHLWSNINWIHYCLLEVASLYFGHSRSN